MIYDIQWQRFSGWELPVASVFGVAAVLLWLLRHHVGNTLPLFVAMLLVSSAVLPSRERPAVRPAARLARWPR